MRGILAQRNAREISEQAPIPGVSGILSVCATQYAYARLLSNAKLPSRFWILALIMMLWLWGPAADERSGNETHIYVAGYLAIIRAPWCFILGLLRFDIHCKIRLQDTAFLEFSWKLCILLKSPLSGSALSIVYFLPSIPSPQIQRDRCFEHIKAKEVYIIPHNSIFNNILFTFSIVQNAKLYYRKRLKANIRHARATSPESRNSKAHTHLQAKYRL